MSEEIIIENTCTDEPKSTDYKRSDVFGDEEVEWAKIVKWPKDKLILQNQNSDKRTYKACTRFGLMHCMNAENVNEFLNQWFDYKQDNATDFWLRLQQSRWRLNIGSSLQSALNQAKKEWFIDWYVVCETEDQMKKAIDNWMFIYTGSDKIDWTKTGQKKETVLWCWWGHAFCIWIYDNYWFIPVNSFGEKRGNWWYWTIHFGMKNKLYTTYAVIDKDSSGKLNAYKFNNEFNQAIKLWITNGTNPDKPATRKEVAVMIYRATKK